MNGPQLYYNYNLFLFFQNSVLEIYMYFTNRWLYASFINLILSGYALSVIEYPYFINEYRSFLFLLLVMY
jgi:hypothetical protein